MDRARDGAPLPRHEPAVGAQRRRLQRPRREARAKGEIVTRRVQTGFDSETGKPIFEEQPLALENCRSSWW